MLVWEPRRVVLVWEPRRVVLVWEPRRVVLVWEPRRVVPSYAVPADDLPQASPVFRRLGSAG